MTIWIILTIIMGGIIFLVDFLLRRKKWNNNTKEEQVSLLVNMLTTGPYVFLSMLGMLWGLTSNTPETALGELLYNATLTMGGVYFIVAIIAVLTSLILRKKGKIKASIWVNIFSLAYIIIVLVTNYLVGIIL